MNAVTFTWPSNNRTGPVHEVLVQGVTVCGVLSSPVNVVQYLENAEITCQRCLGIFRESQQRLERLMRWLDETFTRILSTRWVEGTYECPECSYRWTTPAICRQHFMEEHV